MRELETYYTYLEYENKLLEIFEYERIKSDNIDIYYEFRCIDLFEKKSYTLVLKDFNILSYNDVISKYPEYVI